MRFEVYDPSEVKQYRVLDPNGEVLAEEDVPSLSDEELLYLYKTMLLSRIIDEKTLSYQRQGRMLTYAPNIGQEAAQVGSAYAMEENDWFVPSFRELGGWLVKRVPLKNIYLYWYGNEWGSYIPEGIKALPVSVPIASQLQHATGIGMANNIKGEKDVVLAYVGDGGTSQGDFHEALNFAAVFKAPVVFVVQNNQYAISVPRREQTASKTIAQKAIAYGMPGILVDGNDIFAIYNAAKEAVDRARRGKGPTLIEAYTYRLGAHTTSDDPTKYRENEEVEKWKPKDPILRFKKYLQKKGTLTEEWEEKTKKELENQVTSTFEEIENKSDTLVDDIFKYHYETMPPHLEEQLEEYKSFLEGGK
ncbi:pyruvate dehydrogenase (acetyl-transferring) E1 component subunit alpha [Tepidimicrobium xylanilyticum]|uniref:pyruvate dehydrogenase (acetyl-transferring) E1 component subunit alpha n=1 Tax=Tepidimicrobium xylanilyticum TaxID=1123352 RepID=UPI00264DD5B0|nr:pyruvate dehydrogenase (acetyl-transferring) E1 component subunit alpha [Tepidimicrobium xylanilyticum]GMG97342.1 pyruvate dehydrogenase (acetyl-transferring) E1 component subunit alpha [Tepidimicrobium xylanilyticum]